MNSILLPIGLVACAAVGTALWLWPTEADTGAPTASVPEAAPVPPPAAEEPATLNARWTAPKTVTNPDEAAKRHLVKLPTGEYVKALNGAVGAPPLEWPREIPYSPIIGIERAPNGKDWWVHADGSKSMTDMAFRSDLGRLDAITQVANPTPALPIAPDEFARMTENEKGGKNESPSQPPKK